MATGSVQPVGGLFAGYCHVADRPTGISAGLVAGNNGRLRWPLGSGSLLPPHAGGEMLSASLVAPFCFGNRPVWPDLGCGRSADVHVRTFWTIGGAGCCPGGGLCRRSHDTFCYRLGSAAVRAAHSAPAVGALATAREQFDTATCRSGGLVPWVGAGNGAASKSVCP